MDRNKTIKITFDLAFNFWVQLLENYRFRSCVRISLFAEMSLSVRVCSPSQIFRAYFIKDKLKFRASLTNYKYINYKI